MKVKILLTILLIGGCVNMENFAQSKTKIAFLSDRETSKLTTEQKAAYDFLKSQKDYDVKLVTFSQLKKGGAPIKNTDALWFHQTDSADFNADVTNAAVIKNIKNYLSNGGNLLLTMEALKYVVNLGLETERPKVRYAESKDEGYGRKLGLHSYRNHPVFDGMFGGAYIWNAYEDNMCRQVGYFDNVIPNGRVVAVNWAYITLYEDSKLILEYEQGKGKVLSVGAYTYYAPKNFNRPLLERFTKNSFDYMLGKLNDKQKLYWTYEPQELKPFASNYTALQVPTSKTWNTNPESMTLTSLYGTENSFDVAGERMVILGKEKGGVEEIWAHPFMAMRDYEVGIKFSYRDSIYWLSEQRPSIEVKPESFTRTYNFARAFLKEVVVAHNDQPAGVLHYEYRGMFPAKLIIKFKSNMRYMWPYSERALGSIYYSWNKGLHAYVLTDKTKDFNIIVGASKDPVYQIEGRFNDFIKKDSTFTGVPAELFQFMTLQQFNLKENDDMDVVIVATDQGEKEAQQVYKDAFANPQSVYESVTNYTRGVLKDKLTITTPNKDFNEGYRWALFGTDRFFVNTPNLGKALVAGYSSSATGWDGAQKVSGRPGYAWYFGRDSEWSGYALLNYGDFAKVKEQLIFLQKYQELTGKILHEFTTSGMVHYDAADATPLYIILAGRYLRHSGDVEFIKESWPYIKKALDFCFATDTDGDHLIENTNVGHGWTEGGQLYGTHTTLYLAGSWAAALNEASYMAEKIGLTIESKSYADESALVTNIINRDFWNKNSNFYNDGKWKDGTYLDEPTVQVSVPIIWGVLDKSRIPGMLNQIAGNGFSPNWGVRIVSEKSSMFRPYGYHYGSVWPLFTGWVSLAEYKSGKYDQGFFHQMANLNVYKNWSLGFVEEVINGAEYKPSGVCGHQCWSETMVLQPAIEGMLGFAPNATENKLTLAPHFPSDWDYADVNNIKVGKNNLSFEMKREQGKTVYTFANSGSDKIAVEFNPSLPLGTTIEKVLIDGKPGEKKLVAETQSLTLQTRFDLSKKEVVEVYHSDGIAVLPVVTNPQPGDSAAGLRIISSEMRGTDYIVNIEGMNGSQEEIKVYCPGKNILSVENGEIAGVENGIYKIKVNLVHPLGKYVTKEIKIKTNPR